MTNGKYKVTIEVELTGMESGEEATRAIVDMIKDMDEQEEAPIMSFELIEAGVEQEYLDEEEEVQELEFEQAS